MSAGVLRLPLVFVSTDQTRVEFEATLIFYIEAWRKNISVCEFVNWNHCHKNIAQSSRAIDCAQVSFVLAAFEDDVEYA